MRERTKALQLLGITAVAMFVAHGLIMLVHQRVDLTTLHLAPQAIVVLSSLWMTLLAFPVIYLCFFRPLLREVAERRVREQEVYELLRAIEQSTSMVLIAEASGNVTYVNPAFTKISGYERYDVTGKTPRVLESRAMPPSFYTRLRSTLRSGKEWRGEFLNRRKSGELYWVTASISPIRNDEGNITHFLAVGEDITEKKQIEAFKDEFAYVLSHELRTPLASIQEGMQLFTDGSLGQITAKQQGLLNMVTGQVARLIRLVRKVEMAQEVLLGRLEYAFKPMYLRQIVSGLEETFRSKAASKGITIQVDQAPRCAVVNADAKWLSVALNELMDNALRATPEGGRITLSCAGVLEGWKIGLEDTGSGIPAEEMSSLFSRFRSIGGLDDRRTGGIGVGLFIAKGIIEAHRGSIEVESADRKGTRVTVSIPNSVQATSAVRQDCAHEDQQSAKDTEY